MVSMKQIAEKCGVSVASVSKALNDHKDIGENTKARIRQTAAELGYYPNAAARTLKTNRSYNIGVLFADAANSGLTHDYFSAVLESFKTEAESRGYDITFLNTHTGTRSYLETCRQRSMDGVVIACIDFERPEVKELMQSQIPVITIDYHSDSCSSVISENKEGMQALTNYIISKGHRQIAYIHGDTNSPVTHTRLEAFRNSLQAHNLTVNEDYILPSAYLNLNTAAECTRKLLSLPVPPSCILYPDDTALLGGLHVIHETGLKIPQDISIAGYDGLRVSRYVSPQLTTVHQNTERIGLEAAVQLIRQIENVESYMPCHLLVNAELVVGDSVGEHKSASIEAIKSMP